MTDNGRRLAAAWDRVDLEISKKQLLTELHGPAFEEFASELEDYLLNVRDTRALSFFSAHYG